MSKKPLILIASVAFLIIPQISLAAWWNPLSWFDNWISYRQIQSTKDPTNLIQQETKLNDQPTELDELRDEISALKKDREKQKSLESKITFLERKISERDKGAGEAAPPSVARPTSIVVTPEVNPKTIPVTDVLGTKEVIAKLRPSVVQVETENGRGSGILIDKNYILTNAHVIEGVHTATINLPNGRSTIARVSGREEEKDIALLSYSLGVSLQSATLGNSDNLEQGDTVYTMGYPLGLGGGMDVKTGIVSRIYSDAIGISADILPGNSGGPLVNEEGHVVGINSFGIGKAGEQLKFAIPINAAKDILPELKNNLSVFKNGTTRPPNIACASGSSNINGECVCDVGYARSSSGQCQWGADYCTTNFGLTYIYSDRLKRCVCDTTRTIEIGGRCVPKN